MSENEYSNIKQQSQNTVDEYKRMYYSQPSKWNESYELYTAENTMALNEAQQNHFVQILNQKGYNMRLLVIGAIWILAILFFIIINPFPQYHHVGLLFKVVLLSTILGLYVWHVINFVRKPYNLINRLLPELLFCSSIYLFFWV